MLNTECLKSLMDSAERLNTLREIKAPAHIIENERYITEKRFAKALIACDMSDRLIEYIDSLLY